MSFVFYLVNLILFFCLSYILTTITGVRYLGVLIRSFEMMKCTSKGLMFAVAVLAMCLSFILFTGKYKYPQEDIYVYVNIDVSKVVFETDKKFLSLGLDTSFLECSFRTLNNSGWKRLEELSSLLSPAYLRLGGTMADEVIFRVNGTESLSKDNNKYCTDDISKENFHIITGEDWIKINNFASKSHLNLIYDLNVLLRNASGWNSSNAQALLNFSAKNGFQLNFQLGNEPNSFPHVFNQSISGSQLAKDFDTLKLILNSSEVYNVSKLIGPDVTRPKNLTLPSLDYLREFLSNTNSINAVSWHQYYLNSATAHLEDFINPEIFNQLPRQIKAVSEVVRQFSPDLPIWISETSSAFGGGAPGLSDRFVDTFLWLDKLGISARLGVSVIIRQTLLEKHYSLIDSLLEPAPDYWISLFYKKLVGNRAFDVTVYNASEANNFSYLRFYSHCSVSNVTGKGSVVLFGMNLSNTTQEVIITGIKTNFPFRSYIFTSENQNLTSKSILLNGKKLVYDNNSINELLENSEKVKFPLQFPGYSIAFWVFQEFKNKLCYEE